MTLTDASDLFIDCLRATSNRAPNTIRAYRADLSDMVAFLGPMLAVEACDSSSRLLKKSGHCCWRRSHGLQVVPMQWAILAKFGAGLDFRGSSAPC